MLLGALLGDEDDSVEYGVGSVVGDKDGAVGCADGDELGSGDSLGMLLGCDDGCADGVHSSQRRQDSGVGALVIGDSVVGASVVGASVGSLVGYPPMGCLVGARVGSLVGYPPETHPTPQQP